MSLVTAMVGRGGVVCPVRFPPLSKSGDMMFIYSDQVVCQGFGHGMGAAVDLKLLQNIADMVFYRVFR